jgi:fatty acid synthase
LLGQIGLVDVLRSVGIEPDNIIGHSVGELGCAYADGCLTAEQMILSAYSRGLASIETKFIHGSMAAVGLGYEELKEMCPADIEIACYNASDNTTVSGPAESMKSFVTKLQVRRKAEPSFSHLTSIILSFPCSRGALVL